MSYNPIQDGRQDPRVAFQYGTENDYSFYSHEAVHTPNAQAFTPTLFHMANSQEPHDTELVTPYPKSPNPATGGPLHQRGWSESTIASEKSSAQGFLPSPIRSLRNSRSPSILRPWRHEIITIIIALAAVGAILGVLARFNGHALPDWPYYITLNALIAVLAAVATANITVGLQSSMSQLKWIRFTESRAPVIEMEAFDEASRGVWGAIKLLARAGGGFLGFFGATITLVALLLGPFAQQVVTYQSRVIESQHGASVPRALNFTPALPGTTSSTGYVPILPLKSAVYNGLFAENGRPGAALSFECQSGNCTWDNYDTLGVCGKCIDLTPFVTSYCVDDKQSSDCGWQVPQGAKLTNSSEVFSMTSLIPSARGDQPHSSIMRLIFMGTESWNGTAGEVKPFARQCTLSACLQTLTTNVSNGILGENVTHVQINSTVVDNTDLTDGHDHNVYVAGADGTSYELGIEAMLSMRGWFSSLFANGSASRSTATYNRTITDNSVVVNLTVGISSGETFFDSDIVTAFYWNYYEYAEGLDLLINDMATSMTVAFRSFSGAVPISGRAIFTESYVHVRWGFAVLPIIVVVSTALFLAATIFQSKRKETQAWKGSALAMLLHGLDETAKLQFRLSDSLSDQKLQAKSVHVHLEETEGGDALLRV
ncbi:hypothetical protein F5Y18DRAFT_418194 [Xylariaceae sp. FL1019]|nr:hypothetical protein F5Y18DRAFT_418194 [Xylariaceae sp. FL1019]